MKPSHVLAYANYRIEALLLKIEAAKALYAISKVSYEAKFLPKLFGWKYEDSIQGDDSWHSDWFSWNDYHLNRYKILRDKATYHEKMEYAQMKLTDDTCENSFYKWCNDNNIPY